MKSSNIRHHQGCTQNKGRNGNSWLQTIPHQGQAARAIKGWKGAIAALERLYLPNCKQASLLSLLGVLDCHHLPHKGRQRSTQKTEQQRRERRQVAATALAKLLSYSDPGRAQNAVLTESGPLRAT